MKISKTRLLEIIQEVVDDYSRMRDTDTVISPRIARAAARRISPEEAEEAVKTARRYKAAQARSAAQGADTRSDDRYGIAAAAAEMERAYRANKGKPPNPDSIAAGTNNPWSADDDPDPEGLDPDEVGTQTLELEPKQWRKLRRGK